MFVTCQMWAALRKPPAPTFPTCSVCLDCPGVPKATPLSDVGHVRPLPWPVTGRHHCHMLAAAQTLTKPSDGVAILLVSGEELVFIGAMLFMAATFRRNARLKDPFTSFALTASVVGAALTVAGTVESLGALDWEVKAFAGAGLAGVLVAVAAAFRASRRLPHGDVEADVETGGQAPDDVGKCDEWSDPTKLVEDGKRDQGSERDRQQRSVERSQLRKPRDERGEASGITRPNWCRLARHALILPLCFVLGWLSRSAARRLLAAVLAKVRAERAPSA